MTPEQDMQRSKSAKTKQIYIIALLGLMLVTCFALLASALNFQQRISSIRDVDNDNQSWSITQMEIDQRNYVYELDAALLDAENFADYLPEIRKKFDILYSRIDIFEAFVTKFGAPKQTTDGLATLLERREAMTPKIDAIETIDLDGLRQLREEAIDNNQLIRDLTVQAMLRVSEASGQRREEEQALFIRFFVQSLALFVFMGVGTYLAIRLWRELEQSALQTSRLLSSLNSAFASSLNAVLISDEYGRIQYCNDLVKNMFGYSADDMIGQPLSDLLTPPDKRADHKKDGQKFVATSHGDMVGQGLNVQSAYRADGTEFPVEISLISDTDVFGEPIIIAFLRDISERVASRKQLISAVKRAEDASNAKSMFLATMSHEMRTPLHGLISSLGLIDESELSSGNKDLLKTARECSQRTLDQVNDILELTSVGASKAKPEEFAPFRIAADIVDELRPMATERHNRLELVTSSPNDNYHFEGLPAAFSRALYNLVGNAVKFTSDGKITLSLDIQPGNSDIAQMTVSVKDTGIGIAPENQQRIFENFETAIPSEISADMGTGLGLPIAKLAVEQQGGKLELESTLGKGSRFYFTIPLKVIEEETPEPEVKKPAAAERPQESGPLKLLVVEDNDINRTLMNQMLTRFGHSVDNAQNGQIAVDLASQQHYDAILMDFSMPVMDGETATRLIREGGGPSADTVIIGVTALIEATKGTGPAALMDNVLIKPVSQAQIKEALRNHVQKPTADEPEEAAIEPEPEIDDDLEEDVHSQLEELKELMGEDAAINLLRATLEDAALAIEAMTATSWPLSDRAATIHKAVGSCGVMGLTELSETLSEAEHLALAGTDPGDKTLVRAARSLLDESREEFRVLCAERAS